MGRKKFLPHYLHQSRVKYSIIDTDGNGRWATHILLPINHKDLLRPITCTIQDPFLHPHLTFHLMLEVPPGQTWNSLGQYYLLCQLFVPPIQKYCYATFLPFCSFSSPSVIFSLFSLSSFLSLSTNCTHLKILLFPSEVRCPKQVDHVMRQFCIQQRKHTLDMVVDLSITIPGVIQRY